MANCAEMLSNRISKTGEEKIAFSSTNKGPSTAPSSMDVPTAEAVISKQRSVESFK